MASSSYEEPSDVLKRLFLPPKDPSLTLSSDYQWLVLTQEPPLPSISLLAKPEEKLAGIRFDPKLLSPSRLDYATSLALQHMVTGDVQKMDLPEDSEGIRYIRFHPSRPTFVFASKVKNEPLLELYKCELVENLWRMKKIPLGCRRMNFVSGCAYQFTAHGGRLLVKTVPANWPDEPPKEPVSVGPSVQVVAKGAADAPGRTYQDLLKNKYDEAKLRHYLTTELLRIDIESLDVKTVGQSGGGRLVRSIQCSPCSRFLLVALTTTFSYSVPISRFGRAVRVWDLDSDGDVEVASVPVDDEIPLGYDTCSRHPRSFQFHPCEDHTIIHALAADGGKSLADPFEGGERDALYVQTLDDRTLTLENPIKWVGLEWRYNDLEFTESGIAMIDEYRWNDRMQRKWMLDDKKESKTRLLWERSWENRYDSPGEPLTRRGKGGKYLIVQPTPTSIYLSGSGASPNGDRPFLDQLDFAAEDIKTTRLWRCAAPLEGELDAAKEVGGVLPSVRRDVYESLVCLLYDNETIMFSREGKIKPRNYFLTKLQDESKSEIQVTDVAHPQPDLLAITKELVQYKREDGVDLTADLYLPANYDGTPCPTLFWAYPREFKNAKAAGQLQGSKHRFVSAHWASPVHWAAKGWVIMDDFSLPVIGEGDVRPNDTFIEQIVSGAKAAVDYVTSRGVCDPKRCAVGGHSYGSFMTAHLLSHTSLFAAGIGRSGAFNRTLTPMSFQSEDRSIWEAQDTYITMSPLMHVKKYSLQECVGKLLLIHGEADENSGTYPMQSERYFAALKAFGIESRLVILPHERHSYRAKESILHMAWEQEEWLKSLDP